MFEWVFMRVIVWISIIFTRLAKKDKPRCLAFEVAGLYIHRGCRFDCLCEFIHESLCSRTVWDNYRSFPCFDCFPESFTGWKNNEIFVIHITKSLEIINGRTCWEVDKCL